MSEPGHTVSVGAISRRFRKRDQLEREAVGISSIDGTYLRYRPRSGEESAQRSLLPAIALMGREHLLHIGVGNRESYAELARGSCRRWWPEE